MIFSFFFCDLFLSFVFLGFTFIILISNGRKSLGVKALFDGFRSLRAVLSVVFQFHWMDYLLIRSLQDNYSYFLYPIYPSFSILPIYVDTQCFEYNISLLLL